MFGTTAQESASKTHTGSIPKVCESLQPDGNTGRCGSLTSWWSEPPTALESRLQRFSYSCPFSVSSPGTFHLIHVHVRFFSGVFLSGFKLQYFQTPYVVKILARMHAVSDIHAEFSSEADADPGARENTHPSILCRESQTGYPQLASTAAKCRSETWGGLVKSASLGLVAENW